MVRPPAAADAPAQSGRATDEAARTAQQPSTGPVVVLVGPMGAGKSTVGALIAARLGAPVVDTDALIVERTGRSISDIFVEQGETYFRELELESVLAALQMPGVVVALGGGAVLDERARAALQGHPVVFLDLTVGEAAKRAGFDMGRPLLGVNPRATWTKLMNSRRAIYEEVATITVPSGSGDAEHVAELILAALEARR